MTDRGYGRISLDTIRSGSITKQRTRIEKEASSDFVWYADESVSGSKVPFAERPAGGRLLADLRSGDRILITKIDRAARSVKDLLSLIDRIKQAGATVRFIDQPINTEDKVFGEFLLTLLGAIAQLEAEIIAERRRESLETFRQQGRHAVGKAPFGFQSVLNPSGRGLVIRPHPDEAPVLRGAIARVVRGETQESVAESIGMSKTGFKKLLTNPRLAGMTPYGKGVVTIDGVPRIDPEAAIIDMAEWTRLQAVFNTGKGWNRHEGIGAALKCGVCGERLYFQASKRKPEYATFKCRRVHEAHLNGAPSASVVAHKAEEYVERVFLDAFGDKAGLLIYWEDNADERTQAVSVAKTRLAEIRRRQDEAETDEEEEALMVEYLAAKKVLREAEALPTDTKLTVRPSGKTVREEWESADMAARVDMLKFHADFIVQPGRHMPIEKKIVVNKRMVDTDRLMSQVTSGVRPLREEFDALGIESVEEWLRQEQRTSEDAEEWLQQEGLAE